MDYESQAVLDLFQDAHILADEQEPVTTDPAEIEGTEEVDATPTDETQETAEPEVKIDYNQEVPLVNGEKMTVGKLKDYYQAQQKQAADFVEKENAVMRQLDEVNRLSQYLNVVPEHIRQQAAAEMQNSIKEEFTRMLDVIPQWKDAVEFNKGKESIFGLAKEYGLERDIAQVSDHRVIKLLYDYARIREGVNAAKELKPAKPTNSGGKTKSPVTQSEKQQALINRAKASKSHDAELAAIQSLF